MSSKMTTEKNFIRCNGCEKILGEMGHMNDGKITITCSKCKVVNVIEAQPKREEKYIQNAPYQNRLNLVKK